MIELSVARRAHRGLALWRNQGAEIRPLPSGGLSRRLLKVWDGGHGSGLEPEDLAAWIEWEEEAYRYGVDPEISREVLAALIEGSTVELGAEEHRAAHSDAGDFARCGRLGGLKTFGLYGPGWFVLLARRRWQKISAVQLEAAFAAINAGRS